MLHSKFNQNFSPFIWNFSLILKKYMYVCVCVCVHLFRERLMLMWVREKAPMLGICFFLSFRLRKGESDTAVKNNNNSKNHRENGKRQPKPHRLNRIATNFPFTLNKWQLRFEFKKLWIGVKFMLFLETADQLSRRKAVAYFHFDYNLMTMIFFSPFLFTWCSKCRAAPRKSRSIQCFGCH